jgi:hypothetical protein
VKTGFGTLRSLTSVAMALLSHSSAVVVNLSK